MRGVASCNSRLLQPNLAAQLIVRMDDVLEFNSYFTFNYNNSINGPLLATAVGLEIILALITNLFVLIFSLCHPKILKQSSNIFLTNFVLGNLVMVVLFMPTIIITVATGEWSFGRTTRQKNITCNFIGFLYGQSLFLSTFTLTAISFDRFLFIVKPFVHKRYMKTGVAVFIVIASWILSGLLCIPHLFGISAFGFSASSGACIPFWDNKTNSTVYLVSEFTVVAICIVTIAVTSIWTFCFTRNFIKNISSSQDGSEHVYNTRIRKILGIFGAMLIVTALTYAPGIAVFIVGIIISFDAIPSHVFTAMNVLFYTITISNPIIQAFFRKELNNFVVTKCKIILKFFKTSPVSDHIAAAGSFTGKDEKTTSATI